MHPTRFFYRSVATTLLFAIAAADGVPAQDNVEPYIPEAGQDGKDVIWLPTNLSVVNKMLDMAKVRP